MNTEKALELIKEGIQGLLTDIADGTDPWVEPKDLAEGQQVDEEDVFEWIYHNKDIMLKLIVGESDYAVDEFTELIISVLNSEWYNEIYQSKVTQVREGFREEADWESTKKSLMPTWTPKR